MKHDILVRENWGSSQQGGGVVTHLKEERPASRASAAKPPVSAVPHANANASRNTVKRVFSTAQNCRDVLLLLGTANGSDIISNHNQPG